MGVEGWMDGKRGSGREQRRLNRVAQVQGFSLRQWPALRTAASYDHTGEGVRVLAEFGASLDFR
jgi:hypothetical protein